MKPGSEWTVGLASTADADAVAELWIRSRRASFPGIPPPVHPDADINRWLASQIADGDRVWTAQRDNKIVAVMVLTDAWIDQLYVDPGWTGCGAGSELVAVAKGRNPKGLDLWTFQANSRARGFYERHGFVEVAMTDGENEERAPDVHYRWNGVDQVA